MEEYWKNKQLEDLPGEIWIDALGYDGLYSVSNLGRVKSEGRWVNNGQSERFVKPRILSQGRSGKMRMVRLSVNNVQKSVPINQLVYYSFYPDRKNDSLNDEVYHKNKIQHDNRLENLGYNSIKGASYTISIALGNVKHLDAMRGAAHPYTRNTAVVENGLIVKRKCRVCGKIQDASYYDGNRNTCHTCRYDLQLQRQGRSRGRKNNKLVFITDVVTGERRVSSNKNKCLISRYLVDKFANTGKYVYPYNNSKHKNPLLVEIKDTEVVSQ